MLTRRPPARPDVAPAAAPRVVPPPAATTTHVAASPRPAGGSGSPSSGPPALARVLARSVRERAARAGEPVSGHARAPLLQRTPEDAVNYAQQVLKRTDIKTGKDVLDYIALGSNLQEHREALQAQYDLSPVGSLLSGGLDRAAPILSYLPGEELLNLAFASKRLRKQAQDYCAAFLRRYEDRYEFHLATRARLLYDEPPEKYGGRAQMGKPTATSAWKVYQAALTGRTPIVLGPIPNYLAMREYTQTMGNERYLEHIESSATYLMTRPWTLLVNAALVTGAIHGGRTIIGAEDPLAQDVLFKDPTVDPVNNFGLSVYGRELIQLVLVHGYCTGPLPSHLSFPQPATRGGLVLNPPSKRGLRPANLFDADQLNEEFADVRNLGKLQSQLDTQGGVGSGYAKLEFDVAILATIKKEKKEQSKAYGKLRQRLKKYVDGGTGLPTAGTKPEIVAMLEVIYPHMKPGSLTTDQKPLPSIEGWRIAKYNQQLDLLATT
jgi:hypothetical protein